MASLSDLASCFAVISWRVAVSQIRKSPLVPAEYIHFPSFKKPTDSTSSWRNIVVPCQAFSRHTHKVMVLSRLPLKRACCSGE